MKKSLLIYGLLVLIHTNLYSQTTTHDTFTYEGQIRLGYQSHTVNDQTKDEFAIGTKIHLESPEYYGLQIGTTLHSTLGNGSSDFDGVPFFDENNENYASIAEAYIKGTYGDTTLILGRQTLDTPLADSDDIGMVPNTFEALTLTNTSLKDTTVFLSHVGKWSGVDSDAPSKFTQINGKKGMQIIGLSYEGIDYTTLSGWLYYLQDEGKMSYFEIDYTEETEKFSYGAILQYVHQDYATGTHSSIYGAAFSLGIKKMGLTTTIAYNKTTGTAAENMFGGGPFVTNAEHNTLKEAGANANTILYTVEWDASVIGLTDLSLQINVDAHTGKKQYASEYDVTLAYDYTSTINLTAIYSDIDDSQESFKNLRVFLNYNF